MNPETPPDSSMLKIDQFARRYRVDSSKTTLREFRHLSGSPILGTAYWVGLKLGLIKPNSQILDGPRRFVDDQCQIADLPEPVRSYLTSVENAAEHLGFHASRYSVSNSTGVNVHGGAIRMLHESSQMFLQILASSSGALVQGYQILISATQNPTLIFASTNGRPNYNSPQGVRTLRRTGAALIDLQELHRQSLRDVEADLVRFDSFDQVGMIMDFLSILFFTDKIERGIYIPVP